MTLPVTPEAVATAAPVGLEDSLGEVETRLAALGSALEVLSEDESALDNLRAALDLEQRLDVSANLWRQIAEIHRRRGN